MPIAIIIWTSISIAITICTYQYQCSIIILDINLTKSSFILEGSFAETLKRQTNVGTDGRTNVGTDRQTDGRTEDCVSLLQNIALCRLLLGVPHS